MRKQKSQFSVSPAEELDLQHQGSLGGDQVTGQYGSGLSQGNISSESNISSLKQSSSDDFQSSQRSSRSEDLQSSKRSTKGPDLAMTSSSSKHLEQESPERKRSQVPEQGKSSKKHHYK